MATPICGLGDLDCGIGLDGFDDFDVGGGGSERESASFTPPAPAPLGRLPARIPIRKPKGARAGAGARTPARRVAPRAAPVSVRATKAPAPGHTVACKGRIVKDGPIIGGVFCESFAMIPKAAVHPDSWRWVETKKKAGWLLVGCPVAGWDVKTKTCRVGTVLRRVLKKIR